MTGPDMARERDDTMKALARTIAITALAAATTLTSFATSAEAGDWRHRDGFYDRPDYSYSDRDYRSYRDYRDYRDYRPPVVVHRRDNSDAIALGVIGLAAGAIIGGAIAESRNQGRQPIYRAQPVNPRYYPAAPRHVEYGGAIEPWSDGWYRYCANRYRSFNASTGTFRGYDGRDHFCAVN